MSRLFLVVFSFSFWLLSCKTSQPAWTEVNRTKIEIPPNFFQADQMYSYHAEINAYNRIVTGILRIKKVGDQSYRLLFSNESGFQLMALYFENGEMKSHQVFDKLNKKIILNNLEKGMQLLFYDSLCKDIFAKESENDLEAECIKNGRLYHFEIDENTMTKISVFHKDKLEKSISFKSYESGIPKDILMNHEDIQLSYKFTLLKDE